MPYFSLKAKQPCAIYQSNHEPREFGLCSCSVLDQPGQGVVPGYVIADLLDENKMVLI
jgi:hypothetical protein